MWPFTTVGGFFLLITSHEFHLKYINIQQAVTTVIFFFFKHWLVGLLKIRRIPTTGEEGRIDKNRDQKHTRGLTIHSGLKWKIFLIFFPTMNFTREETLRFYRFPLMLFRFMGMERFREELHTCKTYQTFTKLHVNKIGFHLETILPWRHQYYLK